MSSWLESGTVAAAHEPVTERGGPGWRERVPRLTRAVRAGPCQCMATGQQPRVFSVRFRRPILHTWTLSAPTAVGPRDGVQVWKKWCRNRSENATDCWLVLIHWHGPALTSLVSLDTRSRQPGHPCSVIGSCLAGEKYYFDFFLVLF